MRKNNQNKTAENKKKKAGFKDAFVCFKLSAKLCPKFVYSAFIKQFFADIIPFVSIIFSYAIINGLVENVPKSYIFTLIGSMLIANLVCYVSARTAQYFVNKYAEILEFKVDAAIAKKSFSADYSQIEDPAVLELLQAARDGANSNGGMTNLIMCGAALFGTVVKVIYSLALIIGVFSASGGSGEGALYNAVASSLGGVAVLVLLCASVVISALVSKADAKAAISAMEGNIDGNRRFSYLFEVCSNYTYGKDIRIYGMKNLLMPKVIQSKNDVNDTWSKYSDLNIKFQCLTTAVSYVLLFVAYLYVGLRAYYGIISIGAVAAGVSAVTSVGASFSLFLALVANIKRSAAYLRYYSDVINLPSSITYGKIENVPSSIDIEFKNVSFKYPGQTDYALKNVSFKINKGEKIAFVGKNGAGKTTLVKLLLRFYAVEEGEILINGANVKEYSRSALYDLFSVVFQDFKLFSYSVKENVVCGNRACKDEDVWACLREAGVSERFEREEKEIGSILYQNNSENGIEISGGEAQKIAVARALYKNAPAVILDEPTSALDPLAEAEVYERFNDLVGGKTSVFVSHRMSSCRFCDRIIVFEGGAVSEQGTHDELLKNRGIYYDMWTAQAKYYA